MQMNNERSSDSDWIEGYKSLQSDLKSISSMLNFISKDFNVLEALEEKGTSFIEK